MHGKAAVQHEPERDNRPERSSEPVSNSKQCQPAPGEQPQACEEAPAAAPPPLSASPSSEAPAEPQQASAVAASVQHAAAESSQPASAIMAAQSPGAESAPVSEQRQPLSPQQLTVAAAVMVVLRRALNDSVHAMTDTKEVLASNMPQAEHFLQLVADGRELFSLNQVEKSASSALREWLASISELCTEAECQPLELFTRSAVCRTHLTADTTDSKLMAARRQRLQGIEASLAISSEAYPDARKVKILKQLHRKVGLLCQHNVEPKLRDLYITLFYEVILLLDADNNQLGAAPLTAGSKSSFLTCFDHMLPGVLDGLLEHDNMDLTGIHAISKMSVPLDNVLGSYDARAEAAKKTPMQMVMLEAAVQGW
ncbi:g5568 [Coccomyxa viridis]|uniref:G5568 protein n=1 Tax=Coccomyxa viridis TaxID=1274662 RepID=A0ABP1FUH8_9CHLO